MGPATTPWWRVLGGWFADGGRIVRRRSGRVALGAVVLLAGVAVLAWTGADRAIADRLAESPDASLLTLAKAASKWGELHLAPLIALAVMWAAGRFWQSSRLVWGACAGTLAGASAGLTALILKMVLGRPRPYLNVADELTWFAHVSGYQSFPSGHTTHCFGIAAAVLVMAPRWGAGFLAGAILVAWSRMYLGRHYLSDVLAGAGLGSLVGVALALAVLRWQETRSKNP